MKKIVIIALSCFFVLSSCSTNDSNSGTPQKVRYLWHLISVTGGVAGVDEQFSLNTVVWAFDDATKTLVVDNKNTDDTIEDGLDSGSYGYTVADIDGNTYLTVEGNEFGSFEISQNILTINQNLKSTGSGTDGFIYSYQVEAVAVE